MLTELRDTGVEIIDLYKEMWADPEMRVLLILGSIMAIVSLAMPLF